MWLILLPGISVGGGNVKIPWKMVEKDEDAFINPKYLPEGVCMTQVHHLVQHNTNAILKHWDNRQKAGNVPFHFRKVGQQCTSGKQASVPTDSEPGEPTQDGELQGDNGDAPESPRSVSGS